MASSSAISRAQRTAGAALLAAGLYGTYTAVSHIMHAAFHVDGIAGWSAVWRVARLLSMWQKAELSGAQALLVFGIAASVILALFVATYTRRPPTHGAARFETRSGIASGGFYKSDGRGLLIGRERKRLLYAIGKEWVSLIAPPRSGKGVGFVIPNLLNYPDSAVVIDIRGEAYLETSGYRAEYGQQIYVWQPYADEVDEDTKELKSRSHRYNPFGYVGANPATRVGDLRDIAFSLIADLGTENDFFRGGAREIIVAIGLYLIETAGKLTFGEIRRYVHSCGTGKALHIFLPALVTEADEGGKPLSERCRSVLRSSVSGAADTIGSYFQELEKALSDWDNPIVVAATDANDFDFRDLRRKRMTIYVVIEPFKLPAATRLLNLFFSQLLGWNMRERPEEDPSVKYECLLMLDEFTAPGRIGLLGKAFGYMAGYGLRVGSICQHHGQIEDIYGKEVTKSYLDSHAVTIAFPPRAIEQAERLSRQLGTYTLRVRSTTRGNAATRGSVTQSESEVARALLMPQELVAMALESSPAELIFSERALPIKCQRIVYYQDKRFLARKRRPVEIPLLAVDLSLDTPVTKPADAGLRKVKEADVTGEVTLAAKYDPTKLPKANEDPEYQAWCRRQDGDLAPDSEADDAFFRGLVDRLEGSGAIRIR